MRRALGSAGIVLGVLLLGRLLLGCGDFSPEVGPLRDAATAWDDGWGDEEYDDAGPYK
jgi:hypothetical protein